MVLRGGKRKFPRKAIKLGIMFKRGIAWHPATVRDLSVQAVSFHTDMEVLPGDCCHIYFNECKEIMPTQLEAKVVRREDIETCSPARYLVIVELIEPSDKYVTDVQAIFQLEN
jgi:hypothetical protein